ncbi:MAG: ribonuclease J [Deltaproteobacteria bacterium RBG_13_49_15]|nr:MAG: ribonuclease J [Deltaproteobacteria bacterium RBG_13_49_15]
MLKLIPLGGLGEIGLNMMVVRFKDTLLVIDAGLMFPEDYMLGVDWVIPDMTYLREAGTRVSGIILTHAHEDHIGALPYLLKEFNAPLFGTPFTLGIVSHKLEGYGLLSSCAMHEVLPKESLHIGDLELEFIRVGHSVIDCVGISIKTPYGQIIHTGDFKINHATLSGMATDVNRFARCGEEGVLALLSDSTNVEREGYTISAKEIGETLSQIAATAAGRIIISLFASNISRIQQIVNIAKAKGRKIILDGKSIEVSVNIAKELNLIDIPKEIQLDINQINDISDNEIIMVTTGSQGEPMSSLARMAAKTHKKVTIRKGDTVVFSSKFIPGNEKSIGNIINKLYHQGADVIYEKISNIHASGHAFQEELKLMISLTKPKYFIPIHGEYRHLILHARLAERVGIRKERILLAENGQIIEFDEKGGRIRDRVPTGRILVDGKTIGDVGRSVLKERRLLSEDGLVVVNMAFDTETGYVVYGPELVSRGFVFENEAGHLLEDAKCVILEILDEIAPGSPGRVDKIRARVQSELRKYFNFAIQRRPVILPFILEV